MKLEMSDLQEKWKSPKKKSWNSGPNPLARGGSGAKAPTLAARPSMREQGREQALAYIMVASSLLGRAKEGRASDRRHAGTGEEISARIHMANSHGDKSKEDRRSDRRHSANSLWERVDSCVGLCNYVELIDPTFRDAGGVD